MNVLGISGNVNTGAQDSAAVIMKNGKLLFAQEEERFTRLKHSVSSLPLQSIKKGLQYCNLTIFDIDVVAYFAEYYNFRDRLKSFFLHHFNYCPRIVFKNHHLCHAASAFYSSGFKQSCILTSDFSGDGISTGLYYSKNNKIIVHKLFKKPQSLGIFYSIITQILGFRRDSDEYKVMGMSSYGKPTFDLSWLIKKTSSGYSLNENYLNKLNLTGTKLPSKQEPLYNKKILKKINFNPSTIEVYNKNHYDFAASAQKILNEISVSLCKKLKKRFNLQNLCIAGGVGLNCVMNQAILNSKIFKNIFVQPASSDAGTALGAAYLVSNDYGYKFNKLDNVYLGNSYSNYSIKNSLKNSSAKFKEVKYPEKVAAKLISENKIVGWFQGRHEYGPRALGSRSILANPMNKNMKDIINKKVKFREQFRPFAPSCLEEDAKNFFILNKQKSFPFMTFTVDVKREKKSQIPSVVHIDGTARLQTVSKKQNNIYYRLIKDFKKITKVPIVINTSFNVNGEPIVNTPEQAIAAYFSTGMDALLIGNFYLDKKF
tara:strand:+ start:97 stop:1722 length:1626 start_codon:yes stop_codon:yes gene_type:complete